VLIAACFLLLQAPEFTLASRRPAAPQRYSLSFVAPVPREVHDLAAGIVLIARLHGSFRARIFRLHGGV